MKKYIIYISGLLIILIAINACSSSTEPAAIGNISLSTKYSAVALQKIGSQLVSEVKINKVTYILREIKFKSQQDSTESLYKTTPLILEMNLNNAVQEIGNLTVPFGTFNRLEFDIHRAEAKDTVDMSADQRSKMRPFFAGDKYSVIIEGTIIDGATQRNFVYKSRINVKQKINLTQPIVITEEEGNVNATILISSFNWFSDNNIILDPTDIKNETKIDNNIRNSVRVIRDKNKDGISD